MLFFLHVGAGACACSPEYFQVAILRSNFYRELLKATKRHKKNVEIIFHTGTRNHSLNVYNRK